MAGSSASSREQNFWPGFVDVLANVILVMVFVVVVFSIMMFGTMLNISKIKVEQSIEEKSKEHQLQIEKINGKSQENIQILQEHVRQLQQENQRLATELATAKPIAQGNPAASRYRENHHKAPVEISGTQSNIDVSYALGITTLEKKLTDALDDLLGNTDAVDLWRVTLRASMAESSPSEARRLAYYRIAILRDHLVAKGVSPAHIRMVILAVPSTDGRSHVAIQIRKLQ